MILILGAYVILGVLLSLFGLLFGYYWIVLRKYKGFPIYNVIPYIIHYQMTRKKDVPFTNFIFQMLGDMFKKHQKEGLCLSRSIPPVLYVFSEEPIKIFLNQKAAINKSINYKVFADGLGYGHITRNNVSLTELLELFIEIRNGERWKKHKKLISPAFQLGMLKQKVPLFNEHALALIEDLKTQTGEPSSKYLSSIKRHYFNALSESVFGLKHSEENEVETKKYFEVCDKLAMMTMYRIFQPWLWPKFALKLLPSGRKYLRMYEELHSFVKNVILQMKKHVALNKENESTEYFSKHLTKSLTYLLLQQHLKDPSFSFDDLHAEVNTLMAAGFDTVSYSTMWCLFMLGQHPEVQEKVFQEVQSGNHNYVSLEGMKNFPFMEAVIMETLRLYPTIPYIGRSLSEDVQLGKYKVPKGTSIAFSVYFWHRNPDNFPDPEKFDPERFLNETEMKPWQHIPFAEGNRVCLGKKYALIEIKIFLAHILRNFKVVSLDKVEDLQMCYNIVLTPAKPLRMLFKSR